MNKLFRYIVYTLSLTLVEKIVCICLFEAELLFAKYKIDTWHLKKAFKDGLEVNATRFIFYYLFSVIAFFVLMNLSKWTHRTLQASIYNSVIYISISLFYGLLLPDTFEYFSSDFFYFLIIATFSSPVILAVLGYGKKVFA